MDEKPAKENRIRLQEIADDLRAMAINGLHYGDNEYDHARYQRILHLAAELLAITDSRAVDEIKREFSGRIAVTTPLVGVDAAVFDEQGRILLIQRADNSLWAMPGGAADVGESPAEGAVREAWEETGLRVRPLRLLGVYDSRKAQGSSPLQIYHLTFHCALVSGTLTTTNETLAFGYFAVDELPPLAGSHRYRVPRAFRLVEESGTDWQLPRCWPPSSQGQKVEQAVRVERRAL